MPTYKVLNNWQTELVATAEIADTILFVPASAANRIPTLGVDEVVPATIWDGEQDPEIIYITLKGAGLINVQRAREDTVAKVWPAGTQIVATLTRDMYQVLATGFQGGIGSAVAKAGDTMTGFLTLNANPTAPLHAATKQYVDAAASGVSDGDKGDITVTASGATWTIDAQAVTYAKIQNLVANTVLARAAGTAGAVGEVALGASQLLGRGSTGNIAAITLGTNLSMSGTTLNATGGGVTDGDKGDITVSASGATWTIDAQAISYAKIQNLTANVVLARAAATAGSVGEVALSASQLLGRGATGDIAAITLGTNLSMTGTTLNAASAGGLTDGDKGDITVTASGATWTVDAQAISYAKIQNLTANTVLARAAATAGSVGEVGLGASQLLGRGATGNIAAITLGTNLSMSGTTLNATGGAGVTDGDKGDITVTASGATWTIDPAVVTYAKMQDVSANSVLARTAATAGSVAELAVGASQLVGRGSTGDIAAITLGTNLSMSGTTLNATGGGGVTDGDKGDITVTASGATWTIDANAVTYGKFQQASAGNVVLARAVATAGDYSEVALGASQLLGRGSTGDIAAITVGSGLAMSGTTLSASGGGDIPTGTMMPYVGKTAPSGYLLCDGSNVSRTTFAGLFNVTCPVLGTFTVTIASPGVVTLVNHGLFTGDRIRLTTTGALPTGLAVGTDYFINRVSADTFNLRATQSGANINTSGTQSGVHTAQLFAYGAGDGSTTFGIPDLRGRVAVGADAMGGTGASRITNSAAPGIFGQALGSAGGSQEQTLSTAQLASHSHNVNISASAGTSGGTVPNLATSTPTPVTTSNTTTANAGSGQAHGNVQPTLITNYIIKT